MDIPIEAPKWLHQKLAEDAKRNGMSLEEWAGSLLAHYMYTQEGNMSLDLSKPLRFKNSKRKCWPSSMPVDRGWIVLTYWDDAGSMDSGVYELSEIENIPSEPVRHEVYLRADRDNVSLVHCTTGYKATPNLAKLTVWRDEEGKTRVEIPKEDSCK